MLLVPTSLKPSTIQGLGVFAETLIPKGTVIWRYIEGLDIIISDEKLATLPASVRAQIEDHLYYCEHFPGGQVLNGDMARYINHSDTPNVDNSGAESIAARTILAGEEITCNYVELHRDYAKLEYVRADASAKRLMTA